MRDKFIIFPFVTSLAILIAGFLIAYSNLAEIQNLLIIHFDSFRGIDFLGDKNDVFGILGMGVVVLIINSFLANAFYWKERFLSYLLSFSTAVFSLLLLIAVLAIISIN